DALDVHRTVHALQGRERRGADQLVRVLELRLQRRLHLARVEAREDVDDVYPGDRVLALDAPDELGDAVLIGDLADDAEQGRFLVRFLRVGRREEVTHAEARLLRVDHIEDGGFGDAGRRQRIEQHVRRKVAAAAQG